MFTATVSDPAAIAANFTTDAGGQPYLVLNALVHLYSARILSFDLPAARIAGAVSDKARGRGHTPAFADVAIGAIARHHELTVLTRNVGDYAALGIASHDPVTELPS